MLADYQLHIGQENLLMLLWECDGRSQSELSDLMEVEPPTVTKMLNRLEKGGLLERQRDPIDARICRIYLTDAGWALEEPVQQIWQDLEARLTAHFTVEEQIILRRLLMQVRRNLDGPT
ncbi:MAG: MarR family transcriptional regulator [Cyanobacteria bacterium J06635_15]